MMLATHLSIFTNYQDEAKENQARSAESRRNNQKRTVIGLYKMVIKCAKKCKAWDMHKKLTLKIILFEKNIKFSKLIKNSLWKVGHCYKLQG